MAKSLRASGKKSNRSKLRDRVFSPVENARTERLSAKLLELASRPKPPKTNMEIDKDETKAASSEPQSTGSAEAMDIDEAPEAKPLSLSSKVQAKRADP